MFLISSCKTLVGLLWGPGSEKDQHAFLPRHPPQHTQPQLHQPGCSHQRSQDGLHWVPDIRVSHLTSNMFKTSEIRQQSLQTIQNVIKSGVISKKRIKYANIQVFFKCMVKQHLIVTYNKSTVIQLIIIFGDVKNGRLIGAQDGIIYIFLNKKMYWKCNLNTFKT